MAAHSRRVAILLVTLAGIAGQSLSAQPSGVPSASLAVEGLMPVLGAQPMPANPVGASGTVDVEIVVAASGSIAHARVAASSDATGALDRACLTTLSGWRLTPVTDGGGRPRATLVLAKFAFTGPKSADQAGSVSVRLEPLPQVTPAPLEESHLVGLPDAKQVRYSPPRPLRNITPRYTADAMRAKVQGLVTMELIVLADGTVGAARVTKPLHDSLDRAALVAARYWYFDPARVDGRTVATKAVLQLEFNLR
jgi:TonB family protein